MMLWICLKWPEGDLQPLALSMLQYSPRVACFRHDSVVLEVAGSLSLFKGVRSLCRQVLHTARQLSPMIRLGMAPSATGAWLLAGAAAPRRVLRPSTLQPCLDPLPVTSLPEFLPYQPWLENIGCLTLGSLRKLPRQGLQQRSSPVLLHGLDTAYGRTSESISWFVPPGTFRQTLEPDFHLQQADAILAASQPLLHALCGWLHGRQEALHELTLLMHHEKGRSAVAPTPVALRFSDATWRIEDFNRLFRESLQHHRLHRRIAALELVAGTPHPRTPANDTLFPDPSRRAQDESRLLDLLSARLGQENIRWPCPNPHPLPEIANEWVQGPVKPAARTWPAVAKSRPFWLLPQPKALSVHQERPVHQGQPLRLVQGPERIETGWWSSLGHQRRDYFVAEDARGARYWIYRERETGEGWFLHGLFS